MRNIRRNNFVCIKCHDKLYMCVNILTSREYMRVVKWLSAGKYIPYSLLTCSAVFCLALASRNVDTRVCAQTKCQNQTGPRYAKHEARIPAKVVKPGRDGGKCPVVSGFSVDEEKYDALYTRSCGSTVPPLDSFDDQSFVRAE